MWKSYAKWPAPGATATNLYLHADGSLSFTAPAAGEACRDYVSDPANPVPFRERPISRTYRRRNGAGGKRPTSASSITGPMC